MKGSSRGLDSTEIKAVGEGGRQRKLMREKETRASERESKREREREWVKEELVKTMLCLQLPAWSRVTLALDFQASPPGSLILVLNRDLGVGWSGNQKTVTAYRGSRKGSNFQKHFLSQSFSCICCHSRIWPSLYVYPLLSGGGRLGRGTSGMRMEER